VYNLVVLAQDSVLSPTDTFQSDFSGDDVKEREASESAAWSEGLRGRGQATQPNFLKDTEDSEASEWAALRGAHVDLLDMESLLDLWIVMRN
jgi:hypothetical protein